MDRLVFYFVLTGCQIVQSRQNDGHQSQQFGRREDVLDLHRDLRRHAIDGGQQTQTNARQQTDRLIGRRAIRKERLRRVLRKRERHNCLRRRPYDEQSDPQPQEGAQRPKRHQNVRVIAAGPGDACAQFGVAQSAQRGQNAACRPDQQRGADGSDTGQMIDLMKNENA